MLKHTADVNAWMGLIGALAGATIAFVGQYAMTRSARRERETALLLEQCAQLIALSEDYRNRIWEERRLGATNVVVSWNLGDYRLAEAKLKLLCSDTRVLQAVEQLRETGVELGKAWRMAAPEAGELDAAWQRNLRSLSDFIQVSSEYLSRKNSRS